MNKNIILTRYTQKHNINHQNIPTYTS